MACGPDSQRDLGDECAIFSTRWESVPTVHDGRPAGERWRPRASAHGRFYFFVGSVFFVLTR